MSAAKTLLICLAVLLFASVGCRRGAEEKIAPAKDAATELAKVEKEAEPDEPEPTIEPVVKVEENPGGRRRLSVATPQGQRVELPGDHDPWADRVISFKMGKPVAKICTNPQTTLGKPDHGHKRQEKTCLCMGHRGELILEFVDNRLFDGAGDDLVVFEVGPAVEPMDIEISADGKEWIAVGQLKGAKCTVDIGPFLPLHQRHREPPPRNQPLFRFVKITDTGAGLSNKSQKAGADVDAVGALNSVPAR